MVDARNRVSDVHSGEFEMMDDDETAGEVDPKAWSVQPEKSNMIARL